MARQGFVQDCSLQKTQSTLNLQNPSRPLLLARSHVGLEQLQQIASAPKLILTPPNLDVGACAGMVQWVLHISALHMRELCALRSQPQKGRVHKEKHRFACLSFSRVPTGDSEVPATPLTLSAGCVPLLFDRAFSQVHCDCSTSRQFCTAYPC